MILEINLFSKIPYQLWHVWCDAPLQRAMVFYSPMVYQYCSLTIPRGLEVHTWVMHCFKGMKIPVVLAYTTNYRVVYKLKYICVI